MTTRFFVVATHWDNSRKAQVKYIAGEFSDFMNAVLFMKAYNDYFKADAKVVEDFEMINQ